LKKVEKPRIFLIHWNAAEIKERAARIRAAGYEVNDRPPEGPAAFRKLREDPPAAVVIDLSRLPSHGRDTALFLRQGKATRRIPLVLVEGDPEKVERIKGILPDAVYTTWSRIRSALKQAMAHPPADPVAPKSIMDGYRGTPLVKKLGIRADASVSLVGAPGDFEKTLGKLPGGVSIKRRAGPADLIIWFTRSRKDLDGRLGKIVKLVGKGGMWIAWPKRTSGVESDLTQVVVRKAGLAAGLVDYKICAIDETWTGLKFTRRKPAGRDGK